ncbi:NAD(P)-dependent oxidoreductase [Desertifilum sp. FACHB-1129]|uniref:dTDP-4-dehydrorhamnose reductase n=1 Tax=Desertifilum tharense IPPAS B-1220 TaxID=1781255 RepID=A0A1E5QM80_9CYAN|nr:MULTISPECIES: NAD(P)-dependent oxidoreductase [Desertifilum]MDA0213353.1 NAD(P)-dependent oxidoreductase [Cyanobacteria bacterium FC1]MBD2313710.1 NAD(P)-dependent oxidoreductase [Desertifilum sp. FACHB-1129]MBD2325004.1 NAD(P)-dependent oxidoreductase [Desertifilum sp. FACHB-866]MBD2335143.1 NAD(P)-dependent oxidoreductase [Desertifilum sp. FACHB-868]OEJ75738.1 NAD(P)-dependent oxidoreductase [Desertifilum tharense IPPAS B-1220]
MKKLLVTGASGFLGWNLCSLAAQHYQVFGTYTTKTVTLPRVTLAPVDLTDFAALKTLWQQIQPDAVIHLAAKSAPNFCQTHPQLSYALNVEATAHLASLAADSEIPFVFTSTDLVFDGTKPPYRETDAVNPISRYAEHKVLAEQEVLQRYPDATVCRMPLMFGAVPTGATSFIQPFLKILRQGENLSLFADEYRTPASAPTAAQGLLLALETAQGLLHLGGRERVSRYEFGCLMAEVLELPKAQITACQQKDVPMAAPRPQDVSLDSSVAFALGYCPLSLKAELLALKGCV